MPGDKSQELSEERQQYKVSIAQAAGRLSEATGATAILVPGLIEDGHLQCRIMRHRSREKPVSKSRSAKAGQQKYRTVALVCWKTTETQSTLCKEHMNQAGAQPGWRTTGRRAEPFVKHAPQLERHMSLKMPLSPPLAGVLSMRRRPAPA